MEIDISPSRLRRWYECCKNMEAYGEKDKHPLLDIIQSDDGTPVKVYISKMAVKKDRVN